MALNMRNQTEKEYKANYMKLWRETHKTEIAAYNLAYKERKAFLNKKWAKENPEKVKAKARRYTEAHPERAVARRKRYYDAHRKEALEYSKSYAQANKEKKALYMKAWREANKEQRASYKKAYREAKADRIREVYHAWREKNREHVNALSREWAAKNPQRCKENHKAWKEANPEKFKIYNHEKKARKRKATIERFSPIEIYERDQWVCQLCKKKVNKRLKNPNPLSPSLDHIIPLALGGAHSRQNTHLAHLICNQRAHLGGIKQLRLDISITPQGGK